MSIALQDDVSALRGQSADDPSDPEADSPKKKKKTKALAKKKPSAVVVNFEGRSAQSMLRNGYRAQLDLLALADTKASIMISITGMSASVLVASDMLGLGHSGELLLPSGALLLTFLTALTFAVLAARPPRRTKRGERGPATLDADASSVLHFASISRLTRDAYVDHMAEVLTCSERTHRHMIVHLHELGSWLERKFRLLRVSYGTFLGGLLISGTLFLGTGIDPSAILASAMSPKFTPFEGLYEPSAITQLPDGRILVLQDEAKLPILALTIQQDESLTGQILAFQDGPTSNGRPFAPNDLEGAARQGDFIYAFTSHARKKNGSRQASREQLVRFQVQGDEIVEMAVAGDLRDAILRQHPDLQEAMDSRRPEVDGFNIEGLAFDAQGRHLLVALRKPLIEGRAILLTIENPVEIFERGEAPRIGPELLQLDLDGRGIRSIEYMPELKGHLILAGNKGPSEAQRLWLWPESGSQPQPVSIAGQTGFANGEGLARVRSGDETLILIVSDDGKVASGKPATYFMAPLDDLRIGEGSE